ncbi:MAG: hypothetical protein CM1200mP41_29240 [Gammaproteobacteria bacterium]|nr:MAG: hypothetical protein CM1200mP41_29240 [Gammaproteobacteria bacterium]
MMRVQFVTDVTSGYAVIALMGPRSRTLLRELTPEDLSSAAFPFGASRESNLVMPVSGQRE